VTTRTRRSEARILRSCEFHWQTFHVAKRGTLPPSIRARDREVLREIVQIQARWNEDRALDLLEQLVEFGSADHRLHVRYLAFWEEAESTVLGHRLRAREKRNVGRCFRLNLRSVA
jgi:hypothetical protein